MAKRNKKRKKKKIGPTKHHIIPKSRGGSGKLENLVGLTIKDHRLYHSMFANLTPPEIINYLVNHYWNGQAHHVDAFYKKYKNGNKD